MILVTGINSFVGKYLANELDKRKIKFIGVDINLKENKRFKNIDIRDKKIERYINSNTTIIHLAAISTDKLCSDNPKLAFDVNVNGTINLINIANKKRAKKFIFASTEWVYGNFTKETQVEKDFINIEGLNSLYAITKAIGEKILFTESNKFKKIILRFGIIYGNRKKNFSALESIFLNCSNNKSVSVGSKRNSRRFIHVSDIVEGIIKTLKHNKSDTFNLTGTQDISLDKIIKTSEKILQKKIKIYEKNPNLISIRKPSNKKIRNEIGWKQKIHLLEGMRLLRDYFKKT